MTPEQERELAEFIPLMRAWIAKKGAGTVYIVEAEGLDRIKIGWTSKRVELRLQNLQTSSPVRLILLASFPGTRRDEAALHELFSAFRLHGEWFQACGRLRAFADASRT